MATRMIYLQGEGEHTPWEPESATIRGLIEARLAARPLEEDHKEYFDYESRLKTPDDYIITVTAGRWLEVVAHNLGLDEEFTTPLNSGTVHVKWDHKDELEEIYAGAIVLVRGQKYDCDLFEAYPRLSLMGPRATSGERIARLTAAELGVPEDAITNFYCEEAELIPTFKNRQEYVTLRRYCEYSGTGGFDIGFVEVDEAHAPAVAQLLKERTIDTDGVQLLVGQYGAEAAREALIKKVKALVSEADPEGGGGEGE